MTSGMTTRVAVAASPLVPGLGASVATTTAEMMMTSEIVTSATA